MVALNQINRLNDGMPQVIQIMHVRHVIAIMNFPIASEYGRIRKWPSTKSELVNDDVYNHENQVNGTCEGAVINYEGKFMWV
jgi:hypothetical protein